MHLINRKLLAQKEAKYIYSTDNLEKREELRDFLLDQYTRIKTNKFGKEESEKPHFLPKFFELLGYSHGENYTLEQSAGKGSSDAIVGNLNQDNPTYSIACEWKGIDTKDLEKGKSGETPIDQLFRYMSKLNGVKIGIVSNFLEIRIYTYQNRQEKYYSFTLLDLEANPSKINELYYLLCSQNVLCDDPVIISLSRDTNEREKEITKEFYKEFKTIRKNLFHHLQLHNTNIENTLLLEKTQKILDRLVFTLFCEDTNNLLPHDILKRTYEIGLRDFDMSDERVWRQMRGLFNSIDKGRTNIPTPISAYNGGLFKEDDILDNLHIKDNIWEEIVALAEYDFDSELNVNILGHIFEQSISDIEAIKAEIVAETPTFPLDTEIPTSKKTSKRKKDGIYYTPEYITKYIVENTIGRYLDENPDKLETIKVLDPACGSGAFLNQAHNYLVGKYKERESETAVHDGIDFDSTVVQDKIKALKSIYGVDLQPESVEISKLSLWLKTADREHKLENLDSQIKCGNSLIDDPEIARERAFDWIKQYPEIFREFYPLKEPNTPYFESTKNGFDVIIGNPPYVNIANIQDIKTREYLQSTYKTIKNKSDLYSIFTEKSYTIMKGGAYLGFIFSNSWMGTDSFSEFRKFLIEETKVIQLVKLPAKVFDDATVTAIIIIIKKEKVEGDHDIELMEYTENGFEKLFHKLSYDRIKKTSSFTFSFEPEIRVKADVVKLGDIAKFSLGIKTSDDQRFILDNKKDDDCYEMLRGRDIERYYAKKPEKWLWYRPELMMEKTGAGPRKLELFIKEKILFQSITGGVIKAVLDVRNYLTNDKIHILHSVEDGYNLRYILALASSKFMESWIKSSFGILLEIKINQLEQLPIPKATPEEQKKLAGLVDQITGLKADLHTREQGIKAFLKDNYSLEIKKALPEYTDLIIKISNLTLTQKEELHSWYTTKKTELLAIENEANNVDNQIDQEVYRLYGLSDVEIEIIETNK